MGPKLFLRSLENLQSHLRRGVSLREEYVCGRKSALAMLSQRHLSDL